MLHCGFLFTSLFHSFFSRHLHESWDLSSFPVVSKQGHPSPGSWRRSPRCVESVETRKQLSCVVRGSLELSCLPDSLRHRAGSRQGSQCCGTIPRATGAFYEFASELLNLNMHKPLLCSEIHGDFVAPVSKAQSLSPSEPCPRFYPSGPKALQGLAPLLASQGILTLRLTPWSFFESLQSFMSV